MIETEFLPFKMERETEQVDFSTERLAVKALCAADVLKNTVNNAFEIKQLEKKLTRSIYQMKMIVSWKRGSAFTKMAGSAAKTIGTGMVLIAPLHPKLSMILRTGHKLWKLGTGIKLLNTIACMVQDLWESGFRKSLTSFTHAVALLTRNMSVFRECIQDIQNSKGETNGMNSPELVIHAIRQFIPAEMIGYTTHVINIVFKYPYYSPLFDFLLTTSESQSTVSEVMREIESFHFTEFIEAEDSVALVAIGSLLHINREILDFMDGFQKFTEMDCHFVHDCLTKLTEESVSILKVVSLLVNVQKDIGSMSKVEATKKREAIQNKPTVLSLSTEEQKTLQSPSKVLNFVKQSQIVEGSRMVLSRSLESFSSVLDKGSALVKRRKNPQTESSDPNRI